MKVVQSTIGIYDLTFPLGCTFGSKFVIKFTSSRIVIFRNTRFKNYFPKKIIFVVAQGTDRRLKSGTLLNFQKKNNFEKAFFGK